MASTMTVRTVGALVTAAGVAGIALAGLSACGSTETRSEANFCSTVNEHRDRFTSAMDSVTSAASISAGLSTASDAFAGLGDLWTELAKVAPEDIRGDAETMDRAFGSDAAGATQTENSGGPLSGLSDALDTAQAAVNVNTYVSQHCS